MVNFCSAFNCSNTGKAVPKRSFHRFPLKNQQLLDQWLIAVRRADFKPTSCSRICSDHFTPADFQIRPGGTLPLLKCQAVPSVFDFPAHLQRQTHIPKRPLKRRHSFPEPTPTTSSSEPTPTTSSSEPTPTTSSSEPTPTTSSSEPTPTTSSSEPCSASNEVALHDHSYKASRETTITKLQAHNLMLRKKVKTLQKKCTRYEKRVHQLKDVLADLTRQNMLAKEPAAILKKCFSGTVLEVIKNEMINQGASAKGRRYSQQVKQFAATLHSYSPQAYKYCSQIFCLPVV